MLLRCESQTVAQSAKRCDNVPLSVWSGIHVAAKGTELPVMPIGIAGSKNLYVLPPSLKWRVD